MDQRVRQMISYSFCLFSQHGRRGTKIKAIVKERVPWRQLPVLFNIRTRKNSKLTTQCSGHSSSIFAISISSVALQKQKTIDHCVRDVLSDIASLSKRYFRFSKSFTDIKQCPTIRISPRAHYHWRQHLLKVLQRYVSSNKKQ